MKIFNSIIIIITLCIWQCHCQCQAIETIFKELKLEYLFNPKNTCCGVPSKNIKCQFNTNNIIEL